MGWLSCSSMLLLAQFDEPAVPQSRLSWALQSLGLTGLLIPLLGFALLIGACVLVGFCRRTEVLAAYLLFVPLPLVLSFFDVVRGVVASCSVMAMADVIPKGSEFAGGIAEMGLLVLMGLLATVPAYLVVSVGIFVSALQAGSPAAATRPPA